MPESVRSKCKRILFNFFPAYRGTGGRITYISDDFREVRIRLPLNWRTRNYVGTIFGGSMYGSMDPIYMIMLIHVLGPDYVVWDKSASIRFRKPGRRTLFSSFVLTEEDLRDIRRELEDAPSLTRLYTADLTDVEGTVHATIEKTIYIGRKDKPPARGKNSEPQKNRKLAATICSDEQTTSPDQQLDHARKRIPGPLCRGGGRLLFRG